VLAVLVATQCHIHQEVVELVEQSTLQVLLALSRAIILALAVVVAVLVLLELVDQVLLALVRQVVAVVGLLSMVKPLALALLVVMVTPLFTHSEVVMNRYAIIENGLVVNVVVGQPELAPNQTLVECPDAGPNWTYADGVFTAPVVVEPTVTTPTKEELLVQLNALSAQIQAL
jgi:hypothetical protein